MKIKKNKKKQNKTKQNKTKQYELYIFIFYILHKKYKNKFIVSIITHITYSKHSLDNEYTLLQNNPHECICLRTVNR
jgi:hypothetical protein